VGGYDGRWTRSEGERGNEVLVDPAVAEDRRPVPIREAPAMRTAMTVPGHLALRFELRDRGCRSGSA